MIGAFALAAAMFYFLYSVWGSFPLPFQVMVLAVAPVLALVITDQIAAREKLGHFATMAASAAVACFIIDLTALAATFGVPLSP